MSVCCLADIGKGVRVDPVLSSQCFIESFIFLNLTIPCSFGKVALRETRPRVLTDCYDDVGNDYFSETSLTMDSIFKIKYLRTDN